VDIVFWVALASIAVLLISKGISITRMAQSPELQQERFLKVQVPKTQQSLSDIGINEGIAQTNHRAAYEA